MADNNITAQVKIIIAEHLCIGTDAVTEDRDLETIGADSIDKMELVLQCEGFFDIMVEDEDAQSIVTVQNIIDLVEKLVKEKQANKQ